MTADEDRARIVNTIVRTCANGHPVVTYYARRDEPEPPCPACGKPADRPKENR
jgi:rubrerythrin